MSIAQMVEVPFSEAAMHSGIAGKVLWAIEQDRYVNGQPIPPRQRHGCYVVAPNGQRVSLLKSEAGWRGLK